MFLSSLKPKFLLNVVCLHIDTPLSVRWLNCIHKLLPENSKTGFWIGIAISNIVLLKLLIIKVNNLLYNLNIAYLLSNPVELHQVWTCPFRKLQITEIMLF